MEKQLQFLADFTLPRVLTEEFLDKIPFQRGKVNDLFKKGKLLSYALSMENSKLWVVFNASSEVEVLQMINLLPLSPYMKLHLSELTFYNTAQTEVPSFSLN